MRVKNFLVARKVDFPQKHTSITCRGRSMPIRKNITEIPIRQSSQAVTTDSTGAAVMTINNILSGITDSVNRLSELQSHIGSEGRKSKPGSRRHSRRSSTGPQRGENCELLPRICQFTHRL